ncbi:hypothetical protein V8F06_004725 [Rhypophila decipiens]
MAPSTTSHPIDWRMQTIENCKFISRPGAFVSVVTTKEALGGFKAVVIRVIDGQRQPLFSESAATIPDALKALHTRSAEAVQNHVDANGWDFVMPPPNYWGKNETEKDQGETDGESSYSESASSTVTMSDASDDDMVSEEEQEVQELEEDEGKDGALSLTFTIPVEVSIRVAIDGKVPIKIGFSQAQPLCFTELGDQLLGR